MISKVLSSCRDFFRTLKKHWCTDKNKSFADKDKSKIWNIQKTSPTEKSTKSHLRYRWFSTIKAKNNRKSLLYRFIKQLSLYKWNGSPQNRNEIFEKDSRECDRVDKRASWQVKINNWHYESNWNFTQLNT
jgi:hypothetical protein